MVDVKWSVGARREGFGEEEELLFRQAHQSATKVPKRIAHRAHRNSLFHRMSMFATQSQFWRKSMSKQSLQIPKSSSGCVMWVRVFWHFTNHEATCSSTSVYGVWRWFYSNSIRIRMRADRFLVLIACSTYFRRFDMPQQQVLTTKYTAFTFHWLIHLLPTTFQHIEMAKKKQEANVEKVDIQLKIRIEGAHTAHSCLQFTYIHFFAHAKIANARAVPPRQRK